MATTAQSVQAYRGTKERMVALVREADPADLRLQVPACPEWQVRDLLAHVVGVADDVAAGRIEGAGSEPWTAAQVAARQDRDVDALLDEWEQVQPALEQALRGIDERRAGQVVFDVTTHEHDLRGALQRPGARDSDGVDIGWEWATTVLGQLRDGYGEGALVVTTTDGRSTTCGSQPPTSGVTADRFELWRAMTGRRSAEQVASWEWTGEAAMDRLCLLPARGTPLQE